MWSSVQTDISWKQTLFCLKIRSLCHPTRASKGQSYGDSIGRLSTSTIISRVIPIALIMRELSVFLHFGFPKTVFIKNLPYCTIGFHICNKTDLFISISLHQNFPAGDGGLGPNALFSAETLTPKAPSEREEHDNSHSQSTGALLHTVFMPSAIPVFHQFLWLITHLKC